MMSRDALVQTYVIGKERLLSAIAAATGRRIVVSEPKLAILRCLGIDMSIFTTAQQRRTSSTERGEDDDRHTIAVVGWRALGETWPYFR